MKQIALSLVVVGIFGLYAFWNKKPETMVISDSRPKLVVKTKPKRFIEDEDDDNRPALLAPKIIKSPPISNKVYRDGEYLGPVTDALYGNLQVKAIVKNGLISDVIFLDYPQDRPTSREINTQAMPYLKSEAIAAQSAQVDVITGATQTSKAFIESLTAALNAAI
ncbi:FMN-binding protein [Candidatus Amesbacteria bacterium]|nr:FMN-binding protein [Candidatus Amesbacteria bacterium]